MKSLLASSFLLLFTTSAMAASLDLKIQLKGTDVYTVNGNRLEGLNTQMNGSVIATAEQDGRRRQVEQAIPAQSGANTTLITLLNKNSVEIADDEAGIRATVPAQIKKSLFKGLKSVTVSSEDYLAAYEPVLQAQGLGALRMFNLSSDELDLSTTLDSTDYDCEVNDGVATCQVTVEISIHAND